MRILHVIAGIRKIAGTSVFVCELAREQVKLGHQVDVVHEEEWRTDNYPLDERVRLIGKKSFLKTLDVREYDVVHIHGLWKWMLHIFTKLAVKRGWPIVWSPHGSITPWAMKFKAWKKIPAWWLWQKWDVDKAKLLHVTAPIEEKYMRDYGFLQTCVIAPLGVCVRDKNLSEKREKVLLFVSRIHHKKGLDMLFRAMAVPLEPPANTQMLDAFDVNHWKLRIVGPDENNYMAELKVLAQSLGISDRVEFVGPKMGEDLFKEYRTAELFILPTYSENFGSVVIESLSFGVPVICTKGAPWQELEDYKCGWWPDIGVVPLRNALEKATSLTSEERKEMGERGRRLVEEKYTWEGVCKTVMRGYDSILNARI